VLSSDSNYNHELISYQFKANEKDPYNYINGTEFLNIIKSNYENYFLLNTINIQNRSYEIIDKNSSFFIFEKDLEFMFNTKLNKEYLGSVQGFDSLFWYNNNHYKEFYHFPAKFYINVDLLLKEKYKPITHNNVLLKNAINYTNINEE